MKIVALSDIHGKWKQLGDLPECDILISAGDYSFRGEKHMVKDFHTWLNKQDAAHIISVQGNHEVWVEHNFEEAKEIATTACPAIHFIDEGLIEIEGIKIWCSAITPWFYDWAWNRRISEIEPHWAKIPDDTDILVTHGPPYGILDELMSGARAGCMHLYERVKQVEPDIHIFGHLHLNGGQNKTIDKTTFYNVASCDESYQATQGYAVIDYVK